MAYSATDPYWRLINLGIRPDCAADTVIYYKTHRTEEDLEAYVRSLEQRREVSDR